MADNSLDQNSNKQTMPSPGYQNPGTL